MTGGRTVSYTDGVTVWKTDGQLHSEVGPAIIYDDGEEHWYYNGLRHRIDGPAVEWDAGHGYVFKEWWLNGIPVTEEEHAVFAHKQNFLVSTLGLK